MTTLNRPEVGLNREMLDQLNLSNKKKQQPKLTSKLVKKVPTKSSLNALDFDKQMPGHEGQFPGSGPIRIFPKRNSNNTDREKDEY